MNAKCRDADIDAILDKVLHLPKAAKTSDIYIAQFR